jgi:hypothetical protein
MWFPVTNIQRINYLMYATCKQAREVGLSVTEWSGKLPLVNFRQILGSNMQDIFLMKRMEIPKNTIEL